ncbi:VOC family protein [Jiangella sp. DSM 45060]|uniref:VOC family protein n=1 Tax=Jiangella sp. DSM 45060 TaxID=1798224 RepID=UPI00087BE511|nr:VOC family protein [Jiangella sp. DSM 45060]SDT18100.1 Glyoxalase-like domain-containing protein [Jiangella sp. DSM 45060]
MTVYDLDHLTLGVRHLYASAERLRQETGLRSHEGGWLDVMPTAHRTIALPQGAYINVESVIDHHADLPPGVAAFRTWFEDTTRGGDHWMTWNLRARTRADLEDVARRFGGEVVTAPGARRPDGSTTTTIMAPGNAALTWARGLPNWYFHEDLTQHPARRTPMDHERPVREIAWLELGGDSAELEQHIGSETFAALPLRFVDAPAGLYGVGLTTADGDEIAVRAPSGAPGLAELAARTAS